MMPSDRDGDVRLLRRNEAPLQPYEQDETYGDGDLDARYAGYPPPTQTMPATTSAIQPAIPPVEPRVVAILVGVAMLAGFAVAALLFGVVLGGENTESIGAGGETAAIDQTTIAPLTPQAQSPSDDSLAPLVAQADGSAQPTAADPDQTTETSAAPTPTTMATTVTTVATTVPTTPAPTVQTTTTTTAPPATEAPASTVATPPAPAEGDAVFQQQVLDLTNAERAKAGCNAVILDPTLNAVADAHSEDMAANNYFDHTGLNGSQPWDRVSAAGYPARGSGENIAQGYSSSEAVVAGWMSSPGHRRNMLDCSWTELGVGYAEGSAGGNIRPLYWTQVFATRR